MNDGKGKGSTGDPKLNELEKQAAQIIKQGDALLSISGWGREAIDMVRALAEAVQVAGGVRTGTGVHWEAAKKSDLEVRITRFLYLIDRISQAFLDEICKPPDKGGE